MQPDSQNTQSPPVENTLTAIPEPVDPVQQTPKPQQMPKQNKVIIIILVTIFLLSGVITLIFINRHKKTTSEQSQTKPSNTSLIVNTPTIRAKKSHIECKNSDNEEIQWEVNPLFNPTEKFFNSSEVQYPSEWPKDLRYSSLFKPIEANSGKASDESKPGYGGSFIFEGAKEEAINELEYFFDSELWTIYCEQVSKRDYVIILSAPNNERDGIINIQETKEQPKRTAIFSLLFPDNKNN